MKEHSYKVQVNWTGNDGKGTKTYKDYRRDHIIAAEGKPQIQGSSDPSFRGDATRYNPEELLVASLSACHMLWMLHLCADAGIVVTAYSDHASGTMMLNEDGSGRFTEVALHPVLAIADTGRSAETQALHTRAHEMCFIANSVNFPVRCEPSVLTP